MTQEALKSALEYLEDAVAREPEDKWAKDVAAEVSKALAAGKKMDVLDVGDRIVLTADWKFTLHNEHRNHYFAECLELYERDDITRHLHRVMKTQGWAQQRELWRQWDDLRFEVTLPAGTVLKVDRVYVRKGASDFSSLTFYVVRSDLPGLKAGKRRGFVTGQKRFWAKLADVNTIEYERFVDPETLLLPLEEE